MKFFEPNQKRTTVAVYVFLVALFCVICVIIGANIGVVAGALSFVYEVVKPIIYGFVIAFLMHPIVRFIETKILGNRKEKKIGFRHFLSVILAYVIVLALIFLFCVTAIPQIVNNYGIFVDKFVSSVDDLRNKTAELINSTSNAESIYLYREIDPALAMDVTEDLFTVTLRNFDASTLSASSSSVIVEVRRIFDDALNAIGEMISSSLPNLFSSAVTVITETKNMIIGLFLSLYFLLGERKHIKRISYVLKAWFPKKIYTVFVWLAEKSKNIFRDYITVRLLDGIIIGMLMFICLFIFKTPFAVLLAVFVGIASFFPFIGPMIGIVFGTLILLLIEAKYALLFLIVSVVLNLLDSRYIEPILNAGRGEHTLPAVWVFAAIIIMGGFFGVVGVLIGIPFFALLHSIIGELSKKRLEAKGISSQTIDYFENGEINEKTDKNKK